MSKATLVSFLAPVLVGFALIVLVTGCGNSSDAKKIALIAKSEVPSSSATCERVRDDAIGGRIMTLYDCTLTNVDESYRWAGFFADSTQHHCFAYAEETGVDVSQRFGIRCNR